MGKTINEIRKVYGLESVEGGDEMILKKIEVCNENCANYLLIKYEKLNTNNICNSCTMRNSEVIKRVLRLNKEEESTKEAIYEV
ncbi:hypothetical protein [uncultured Clostridium sp.]|uniref:hypothetical protein n=1 Tax=uncultured Clostridium sp. TaxID=59620 RepID=UPI002639A5A0|nr:hypothetical protein [uncultured Clostridium sp.]